MRFDWDQSEFVLSSGRRFYANAGILGVAEDMALSYGYDGSVEMDEKDGFTAEERKEIADHMIALWQKWSSRSLDSQRTDHENRM